MTPRVFALQFLDGHHYVDNGNASSMNIHRKALGVIGILLLERTDLVKRFFSRPSLETPDIDEVIFLVYTESRDKKEQKTGTFNSQPVSRTRKQKLMCVIRVEDMPLLADCVNDAGLFQKEVTVQEMNDLMNENLTIPLISANLMGIAYFFDCLSAMNLINRCWQTVLKCNGSILQQGKNKPQSRTNYSSALNRAKSVGAFYGKNDIDIYLKHIREKYVS